MGRTLSSPNADPDGVLSQDRNSSFRTLIIAGHPLQDGVIRDTAAPGDTVKQMQGKTSPDPALKLGPMDDETRHDNEPKHNVLDLMSPQKRNVGEQALA